MFLQLNYLEKRKGHLHGIFSDFTKHSLLPSVSHEFQGAAKNVLFLLHDSEEKSLWHVLQEIFSDFFFLKLFLKFQCLWVVKQNKRV